MSLARIKNSFRKLEEKNRVTEKFDVEGISFEVGILSREEEINAQEWADHSSEGFSHVLKLDVAKLSFAIKSMGGLDLSEFIEDEESGQTIQRNIIFREELMRMPSPLVDLMMTKYNSARNKLRDRLGLQRVSLESILGNMEELQGVADSREDIDEISDRVAETEEPV
jgi:hypothetical protein